MMYFCFYQAIITKHKSEEPQRAVKNVKSESSQALNYHLVLAKRRTASVISANTGDVKILHRPRATLCQNVLI